MKALPFYILLLMTFGMACLEKIISWEVPSWFLKQFDKTILNLFPGSLELAYFAIVLLEGCTFGFILFGIVRKEFLIQKSSGVSQKYLSQGIFLAQITFIILGFGQRLTQKYDEAGYLFLYASLTFIAGQIVNFKKV